MSGSDNQYVPAASDGWRVSGHQRLVADLQNAAIHGPRHAYILSGPDQVGKTTIAMEFARALVCPQPSSPGVPCGTCLTCRRVTRGVHPDVTVTDLVGQALRDKAGSQNTSLNIGSVRAISSNVTLRPIEAKWRVAIVDDVETMQETAQEAFLKTLEEPPAYAVILLLTNDVELLLPTILSRCVVRTMQPVSDSDIARALIDSGLAPDQATTIASVSDGRPGWAFNAANNPTMLEDRLVAMRDAENWALGDEFQRLVTATKVADQFLKDREAVFSRLFAVQKTWRRFLLEAFGTNPNQDGRRIVAALKSIEACVLDLEANVRPRLALQNMVLRWPKMK